MPKHIITPNQQLITCDDIILDECARDFIRAHFRELVEQMDPEILDLALLLLFDEEDEYWLIILYLRNAKKDLILKEEEK